MKRSIKAGTYQDYFTIFHGRQKFAVHITITDYKWGTFIAQVSEIHPYDDADYVWAKIENNGLVKFIQNGKILDKMQLPSYEPDEWDSFDDYVDDCLDSAAVELVDMNANIDPNMVHN